ncbi:hypothetical protein [Mycobacterium sp. E802]|uniref:hypothetical protein n=1 Tax=Mycobacterium sp. E802 TaxID=1834152 RepID=UPI000A491133|nr:hypothetical protein [Mycobacterium sp. E802]
MTAIARRHEAHVHMVTPEDARLEIERLLKSVNVTRDELEARGEAWDLDADERGVLSDIRALEFLLGRATSDK